MDFSSHFRPFLTLIVFSTPFFSHRMNLLHLNEIDRLPFDWRNPFGYFVATTLQFIIDSIAFRFIGCLASAGAAAILFGIALIKDLKSISNSVNDSATIHQNQSKCYNQLRQLIKILSISKQFSINFFWSSFSFYEIYLCESKNSIFLLLFRTVNELSKLGQPFLLVMFVAGIGTMCCVMLIFQMELV